MNIFDEIERIAQRDNEDDLTLTNEEINKLSRYMLKYLNKEDYKMKGSEVLKALEEGKKMRIIDWRLHEYIYKNENNEIVDEEGIDQNMLGINIFLKGEWEEYVEDEFEIGDWVCHNTANIICRIIEKYDNGSVANWWLTDLEYNNANQCFQEYDLRKATEEEIKQELERRKWNKIGRKVGQFKVGDIIKDIDGQYGNYLREVFHVGSTTLTCRGNVEINKKNVKLVYPFENSFGNIK